jgi:hypothetical protein
MLEPLKRAIVESYVGAIALGWLLAEGVAHSVGSSLRRSLAGFRKATTVTWYKRPRGRSVFPSKMHFRNC